MWVVSKIIGDGLSHHTSWRTAAQQYGLRILNANHIPVAPKTGRPTSDFALLETADEDAKHLAEEAGCVVLPKLDSIDARTRSELSAKLLAQACVIDISQAAKTDDIVVTARAKVAADGAKP